MPPYKTRKCPKCQQSNHFDMAKVQSQLLPIYRDASKKDKKEYPVTCKHCGHKFIIKV